MNLAIVAISADSFKNPEPFLETLMKLFDERKIILATNKQMRANYEKIYDKDNSFMRALLELIKHSYAERLHVELNGEIPWFVNQALPEDVSGITIALVSIGDLSNSKGWRDARYEGDNVGYKITDNIQEFFDKKTNIITKGEPCCILENHILAKTRWASRISVIDPYLVANQENIKAGRRFLDFLESNATNLKVIRFVFPTRFYLSKKTTDSEGAIIETRDPIFGTDAKNHQLTILKDEILTHNLFSRIEKIEVGWESQNTKRYLSFGSDTKEFTLPFDKGVSVHFQLDKKKRIINKFDCMEQLNHKDSYQTVDYLYEEVHIPMS